MITFVGAMDAHATEESMSLLWLVANPQGTTKATVPAAVKGAAISNWTLLLSTLPSSLLAQFYARSELEALSRCLQDADMAVRGAAGEAIALVHEHCPQKPWLLLPLPGLMTLGPVQAREEVRQTVRQMVLGTELWRAVTRMTLLWTGWSFQIKPWEVDT
ncbi:hypothetical protein CLOM_g15750 [Closterium sp. NIES-68]|nr:hypothetical protein CLOM_g15750 [Closterium sp. NIES-68]